MSGRERRCLGVFAERRGRDADVTVLSEARQFFSPRARFERVWSRTAMVCRCTGRLCVPVREASEAGEAVVCGSSRARRGGSLAAHARLGVLGGCPVMSNAVHKRVWRWQPARARCEASERTGGEGAPGGERVGRVT